MHINGFVDWLIDRLVFWQREWRLINPKQINMTFHIQAQNEGLTTINKSPYCPGNVLIGLISKLFREKL